MRGRTVRARFLSTLLLLAAACGNTLVDHAADPTLLAGGACGPGLASCFGACVPEDAGHCGDACLACGGTAPFANGVAACVAGACGFACADGFLLAGGACVRATAVSAGFEHTCAIAGGKVKCWGLNDHGQLGDGTTTDRPTPVDVALQGDATAISAGYVHTCAVAGAAKEVWCWGDNTTGALGDGTTAQRTSPVKVGGSLSDVDAIAAGGGANTGANVTYYGHTCAISHGHVLCWGGNDSGELGVRGVASSTPVQVGGSGLTGAATSLAAGDRHTCAVDAGALWCWGANFAGQLGNGQTTTTPNPDPQRAIQSGATLAAAGAEHSCGIAASKLSCWGDNSSGQINAGTNSPLGEPSPVALSFGVQPAGVAGGGNHTCVVGADGTVTCFGANGSGQLGASVSVRGLFTLGVPPASPLPPASAVTAGFAHTCALLADGGVQCWGANDHGQLGTGQAGSAVPSPGYVAGW
jgi:hypothetical protein